MGPAEIPKGLAEARFRYEIGREVMGIGRNFAEALQKALRMLEIGVEGLVGNEKFRLRTSTVNCGSRHTNGFLPSRKQSGRATR